MKNKRVRRRVKDEERLSQQIEEITKIRKTDRKQAKDKQAYSYELH